MVFLVAPVGGGYEKDSSVSWRSDSSFCCELPGSGKNKTGKGLLLITANELCGKQRNRQFVVACNCIATTGAIRGRAAHDVG